MTYPLIANGVYQIVIGSRILGMGAIKGGMPKYKYIANRFLTFFQNVVIEQKLSEYHNGFRAFSKEVLNSISLEHNPDNYIFDNQMLCQIFNKENQIAEITCPTKYDSQSSTINFIKSIIYGLGVLRFLFNIFFTEKGFYHLQFSNNIINHHIQKIDKYSNKIIPYLCSQFNIDEIT